MIVGYTSSLQPWQQLYKSIQNFIHQANLNELHMQSVQNVYNPARLDLNFKDNV